MKAWLLDKEQNFNSYENRRFQDEAEELHIDLRMVAPEEFDIILAGANESILYKGRPDDFANCLITRFGSGATYFALATVRHLENLGLLVLNSSQGVEVGRDKLATLQTLAKNRLPVPKTMLAKFPLDIDVVEQEFGYPFIIKPVSGSRGRGVFLCESRNQTEDLVAFIEVSIDPKVNVIVQEFISTSRGRDIRVIIVGGRAIGAMLRTAKEGKFKANYSTGGSVSPFALNEAIEWLAVESARVVGLDIAGIDILFDHDGYKICEINCAPGFEGFEQATGMSVPREIYHYALLRLQGFKTEDVLS